MDSLITWNGKLLTPITSDHAFRVRMDVQLYYKYPRGIQAESSPEYFRMQQDGGMGMNVPTSTFWTNYQYYIEVDPPKPEYTPEQRSCDQARKRDHEVRP